MFVLRKDCCSHDDGESGRINFKQSLFRIVERAEVKCEEQASRSELGLISALSRLMCARSTIRKREYSKSNWLPSRYFPL